MMDNKDMAEVRSLPERNVCEWLVFARILSQRLGEDGRDPAAIEHALSVLRPIFLDIYTGSNLLSLVEMPRDANGERHIDFSISGVTVPLMGAVISYAIENHQLRFGALAKIQHFPAPSMVSAQKEGGSVHWLPEPSLRETMKIESFLRAAMVERGHDDSTIQHVLCFIRPIIQAERDMNKTGISGDPDAVVMWHNDLLERFVLNWLYPLATLVIENRNLSAG